MRRLLLPLFSVPLLLAAQTEDLASLSGQVVNAVTGEPIRKATLVLRYADARSGPGAQRVSAVSTTSDASGQFSVSGLEPGSWRVVADRNGFVSGEYGSRKPGRAGTPLVLAKGQSMSQVSLRLWPHGVISGRVVDEDGDAVRGASVEVSRFRYTGPRRQLVQAGGSNTNDLGEYRIFDLAPGKYYLSVHYRRQQRTQGVVDRSPNARPDEDYVTTYYPGTRDQAAAAQLDVAPGAQLRNIDVALTKAHTVRIRGRVLGDAQEGGRGYQVVLMSLAGGSQGTGTSPNGEFELRGIAPGSYTLMASPTRGQRSNVLRRPIEVGSGNIEGLVLTMGQAVAVTGRIRLDGQSAALPGKLAVRFQPYEQGSFTFGPFPNGTAAADGSFKLDSVNADRYRVIVSGLPDGHYVKAIAAANVDVLAAGLDVGSSAPPPLDILVSPSAGEISGTVQNAAAQQPARGATVVLIPQEKERRDNASFYKTATTDASGQFTIRNLVPGNYRVYAWEDVESGAWFDPEFMQPMESKGQSVTVKEGSRETLQITVIPAD